MEQTRVYTMSLGKYNEGELVRVWFTPPVDFDEVKERTELDDEHEEYTVHDYEPPFGIDEYMSVEEVSRLRGLAKELEGTPVGEAASEIQHAFFNSFEEMVKHVDGTIYYPDRGDMSDITYFLVVETGGFEEAPEHLKTYIDSGTYGRGLEIGGSYLVTSRGVFEYPY